jgi:hypothetical protein
MSRVSRLQRARTPPRRRSRAWLARQEARLWVWVLDHIEYTSGAAEGIDPWGRPMTCGWVAPVVIHLREEMRV